MKEKNTERRLDNQLTYDANTWISFYEMRLFHQLNAHCRLFADRNHAVSYILYVKRRWIEKISFHWFWFSVFYFRSIPQNSTSHSSSSEIDEGPAAKLARFTNDLIAENHQRIAINANQSKRKFYESTDENPTDDDDVREICTLYFAIRKEKNQLNSITALPLQTLTVTNDKFVIVNFRMIVDSQAISIIQWKCKQTVLMRIQKGATAN